MNVLLIKTATVWVAKRAASAAIGIVIADTLTKTVKAVANEARMYKAYREAHKHGKDIVQ